MENMQERDNSTMVDGRQGEFYILSELLSTCQRYVRDMYGTYQGQLREIIRDKFSIGVGYVLDL